MKSLSFVWAINKIKMRKNIPISNFTSKRTKVNSNSYLHLSLVLGCKLTAKPFKTLLLLIITVFREKYPIPKNSLFYQSRVSRR